jgi:predicted secreted acid phosphatase
MSEKHRPKNEYRQTMQKQTSPVVAPVGDSFADFKGKQDFGFE